MRGVRYMTPHLVAAICLLAVPATAGAAEKAAAPARPTPPARAARPASGEALLPLMGLDGGPMGGVEPGVLSPDEAKSSKKSGKPKVAPPLFPMLIVDRSPLEDVVAKDWFDLSAPVLTMSGYYRVRAQSFHNFSLGRVDAPISGDPTSAALWPRSPDDGYTDLNGRVHQVNLCGAPGAPEPCDGGVQAGANMRLRINPGLHIGDNVRIKTQFDLLDNVVLGSTPAGYANRPSGEGGYGVVARGGYAPLGDYTGTQWVPVAGVNSVTDSFVVKRVWGEYDSPFGRLSFGRMPQHWGLGMLMNSGDGYDSDWQTTVDRVMFTVAIKDLSLYVSGAWDFGNEGAVGSAFHEEVGTNGPGAGGAPSSGAYVARQYDLASKDDMDQWVLMVNHQLDAQTSRLLLARGLPVMSAGFYGAYRQQLVVNEGTDDSGASFGNTPSSITDGFVRRGYEVVVADAWIKLLYRQFRLEMEAALIGGSIENRLVSQGSDFENLRDPQDDGWGISQFGLTLQSEYRAVEDRLRVGLGFGLATGDSDERNLTPSNSSGGKVALPDQLTLDRSYTTFRFHPNYRVDLLLWRSMLSRVQGAYYFRPSAEYDFVRDPSGHRFGGGLTAIWSRATAPVQAPGHDANLGVELDFKLYYQGRDGFVAGDVEQMRGFYGSLEYGVLFPMAGLDVLDGQRAAYRSLTGTNLQLSPAHMLRAMVGVMF